MLNWFRQLWNRLVDIVLRTSAHAAEQAIQQVDVFSQLEQDTDRLIQAIRDLHKFEFDPKWKTRVINVPRAIDGMQDLFDIVVHGFRDKFLELFQSIQTLRAALEHHELGHFPSPEPQSRLTKVVDWIGAVYTALQAFERAYRDAVDITAMVADVEHRIETLDDLFLPQDKPRTYVTERVRTRNPPNQSGLTRSQKRLGLGHENITSRKDRPDRSRKAGATSPKRQSKKS